MAVPFSIGGATSGAIQAIWRAHESPGHLQDPLFQPVLEVRHVSREPCGGCQPGLGLSESGSEYGRVQLADDAQVVQGALRTSFSDAQGIQPGSLLRLRRFHIQSFQNSQLLVILEADVVGLLAPGLRTGQNFLASPALDQVDGSHAHALTTPERRPGGGLFGQEDLSSSAAKTRAPLAPGPSGPFGAPQRGHGIAQPLFGGAAADKCISEAETQGAPPSAFADGSSSGSAYRGDAPHRSATASPFGGPFGAASRTGDSALGAMQANPYGGISGTPALAASAGRFLGAAGGSATQPPGKFTPVSLLSPYSSRWQIKARVIGKGDVRRFTNAKGEGQLLKVDLADKSGEISATFFGRAVEKFNALLLPGKVYSFSKGQIKKANKRFDKGEHALTFEEHAEIVPAEEDQDIPERWKDFQVLAEAATSLPLNTLVDVKAVIFSVEEPFTFTAKNSGKEMTKRTLGLWDPSGPDGSFTLDLTLWGERALDSQYKVGDVIFLKSARIGEYQDQKNLSSPVQLELSPDHPEAFPLKSMFEVRQAASPLGSAALNRATRPGGTAGARQTLEECKAADLDLGPSVAFSQAQGGSGQRSVNRHIVAATVLGMSEREPYYPSCPELVDAIARSGQSQAQSLPEKRSCNKKTTQDGTTGVWRCAAGHCCQQPVFRYICKLKVADHTEELEVNLFDDVATKLFGCEAQVYAPLFVENALEASGKLQQINGRVEWRRFFLKLRASKEVWQEAEIVRYTLDEATPLAFVQGARQMLAE
ncbi:unnamed protein product, partial [Polarella glacialis]